MMLTYLKMLKHDASMCRNSEHVNCVITIQELKILYLLLNLAELLRFAASPRPELKLIQL